MSKDSYDINDPIDKAMVVEQKPKDKKYLQVSLQLEIPMSKYKATKLENSYHIATSYYHNYQDTMSYDEYEKHQAYWHKFINQFINEEVKETLLGVDVETFSENQYYS